ncbi:MAG: Arc family DNA-binding protein [Lachnospiraceae bacterium]|nr:Arc family DNA-binding protein [Lachnospiraceae bacterium]
MDKEKHLGLRIDSETHRKLKDMADYDGRSINGEVLYLIRQAIKEYEKQLKQT